MAPLTSRKTDMAYFGFFAMFATSMICLCPLLCRLRLNSCTPIARKYLHTTTVMDLIPLWPKAILPTILANNHAWYLATFNDQLMIKFEPWFASFVTLEALYQLPMTLWFLFALPKGISFPQLIRHYPERSWLGFVADDQKLTVHLLVYGVVGLMTTTTSCVAIYMEKDMSQMEKNVLLGFYSPFAVVCMCPRNISLDFLLILTSVANSCVVGYMMMDMSCRIQSKIAPVTKKSKKRV